MHAEKLDFIQHKFINLINKLPAEADGKWGKMNTQQMLEHVTGFFKVSSGKLHFALVTPEEHLPKFKEFLLSDKEFRENTKAPASVLGDEPLPLRCHNMEEAVAGLQKSIEEFIDYFKDDTSKTTLHPVFGQLNFEEWVLLHYKHVMHHGKQFGL
jgi:oxepin-CoA hydrolase/3-oxo-5,6-dehydrosuberyl-CoA semialdehyde dehydrogenase